jgi:hypothetical protein
MTSLNVAMQLRSPEEILGRCMAIYQAITFGGLAIGAYLWGLVADLAGLAASMGGAAALLAMIGVVMHRVAPMPTRSEGRVAL